jgi:transposase
MTHLFGCYNWRTDQVVVQAKSRKNASALFDFLEHLLVRVYPEKRLLLVLDNAPFHHSREVSAFLSLFEDRVQVYYLPPYYPELNLIERFWKHLKDHILANKLFASLGLLLDNLERFLQQQNDLNSLQRFRFAKNFQ